MQDRDKTHQKSSPRKRSFFIPLSIGILTAEHRKRIGVALWEFCWFIDRTTREKDGWGLVLGGKPISYAEIASQLGLSPRSVARNCRRLEAEGYIRRRLAPYGFRVEVAKSKKFISKRSDESVLPGRTKVSYLGREVGHRRREVGHKCPTQLRQHNDDTRERDNTVDCASASPQRLGASTPFRKKQKEKQAYQVSEAVYA